MGAADVYFASLLKFKATALVLASGKAVALRFPQGDRFASQVVQHADLQTIVRDLVPPAQRRTLDADRWVSFTTTHQGNTFSVEVDTRTAVWTVTLAPAAAAPAPAADEPVFESHHHRAETPTPPPAAASSIAPSTSGLRQVERLLVTMKEMGASDLHLTSTFRPHIRQHGEMKPIPNTQPISAEEMTRLLDEITPEKNLKEFAERHDTDFAHMIPNVSRFRANRFRDRFGPGAVFRAIPFQILTAEQLGIPKGVLQLCYLTKGLVVVTGPTGSGKSTTLATLIDVVNANRSDHIITIEDPIEFVHEPKKCLINQREVHTHTRSFKDALRAALREDPDIVLVGEMRDLETIAIAVETAETGHLVFGTLHTTTAPSTIDRIIDQFPPDRQEQIRQMLSESLRGVIAQTLCKKIGGGRVAAYEVLLGSPAVSNLIRERKTFQLFSMMQTGRAQGMMTLNDSLADLVRRGLVEPNEAYMKAVNKHELKGIFQRENIKITVGAEG
jgi:twitching motility protein PilT